MKLLGHEVVTHEELDELRVLVKQQGVKIAKLRKTVIILTCTCILTVMGAACSILISIFG